MTDTNTPDRRNRRGGGRDARRSARSSGNQQVAAPYIVRKIAPVDILSDEGAEIIEDNAETILEEIGIDFRDDPEALTILRDVGCDGSRRACAFPAWSCTPALFDRAIRLYPACPQSRTLG